MSANRKSPRLATAKKGQEGPKSIQNFRRPHQRLLPKTAPSIVTNGDRGIITIKEQEVLYFGIPLEPGNTKKKLTKAQPFSFEVRNKELQIKKQERLKRMKDIEQQKVKVAVHAPSLRKTVKPANKPLAQNNSIQKSAKPEITNVQSQHLIQRNKQIIKKKEENIKRLGVIAKKQDFSMLKTLPNKSLLKKNLTR